MELKGSKKHMSLCSELKSNNTLEVTFDPSLTFAAAKADAASNAPQRGRWESS